MGSIKVVCNHGSISSASVFNWKNTETEDWVNLNLDVQIAIAVA
jgi:hypothetical protein